MLGNKTRLRIHSNEVDFVLHRACRTNYQNADVDVDVVVDDDDDDALMMFVEASLILENSL